VRALRFDTSSPPRFALFGARSRALVLLVASLGVASPSLAKKKSHARSTAAPRPPRATATEKVMGTGGLAPGPTVGPPEVLFTFDDGPAVDKTPKVLDLLDQHKIKAVFFVNGMRFNGPKHDKARELLKEISRRGHAVGNHTVHHYFLCGTYYIKRAAQEVEENASLIEAAVGIRPDLFRTPFGAHCPNLNAVLDGLGIKPIGWDIDPQDWKLRNTEKIQAHVIAQLKKLRGRAILLLHDIHAETVAALPKILDWIAAENQARVSRGEPPIKIIDYSYLIPEHKLVPPLLDALGRVLIDCARGVASSPLPLLPQLAWFPGQV
jgi:peptidoglycan/xylan/chitin deacetylase (PgdA/CDA1 family)